jgi:hypothetical protein
MTLDLTPGETYTFWPVYKERGSTGGQCNWNCSYLETFAPAQYDAPAAPAWTIEPVSSSVDTVWVNAGYSDVDPGCSLTPCQLTEFMRYLITPCPLAIGGSNPNYDCTANYLSYRLYHQPVMVRFALKAGVTYTFGGHMWKAGVCGSGCQKVCCSFTAIPVTAQYTPTPLATRPVTWGKVKALYRSP